MKNKIIIIIFIIVFVIVLSFLVLKNSNNIEIETETEEMVPGEEISDEQVRSTVITLYFMDSYSGELMPEARNIDVKDLMDNPYTIMVKMLIDGPLNNNFKKCIPEGTGLNNCYIEGDILIIDFSKEFLKIDELKADEQKMVIDSILKTLVSLREVNGIKILINGESNILLKNSNINLSDEIRIN